MIVYACSDLIFATKISSTAEALGVNSRPTRTAEALEKRLEQVDDGKVNLPVTGAMIDLSLEDKAIEMILQIKAFDREIPVIAFGPHILPQLLKEAHDAGANFVLTQGQFTQGLPELIERFGGEG